MNRATALVSRAVAPVHIDALESRRLLSAGDLDLSFGTAGNIVYRPPGEHAQVFARQADGKVLIGGTANPMLVRRFNTDGTVDSSFGTAGAVKLNLVSSATQVLQAIAVQ